MLIPIPIIAAAGARAERRKRLMTCAQRPYEREVVKWTAVEKFAGEQTVLDRCEDEEILPFVQVNKAARPLQPTEASRSGAHSIIMNIDKCVCARCVAARCHRR